MDTTSELDLRRVSWETRLVLWPLVSDYRVPSYSLPPNVPLCKCETAMEVHLGTWC